MKANVVIGATAFILTQTVAHAQFRASNTKYAVLWHKCFGNKHAGHECYTMGEGFTDCDWAFRALKKIECCKWTWPKGADGPDETSNSVEWMMESCSSFMPKVMKEHIDARKIKDVTEEEKKKKK